MKNALSTKYSLLIVLIVLLHSCNKTNSLHINGSIQNLSDPEILVSYYISDSLKVDTLSANSKSKFQYKNNVDSLTLFSFYFNNQSSSVVVFAQSGDKISVKGDARVPDLIKVNGNIVNDDLTHFKTQNKELLEYRSLLLDNYMRDVLDPESSQNSKLLPDNDELNKINSVNKELLLHAEEFIQDNPTSLSSLILINEFFANPESHKVFERSMEYLKGDLLKTKMALNLNNYLKKLSRSAEGASMPYFQLVDIKGDTINSYDFRGKYLLMSFVSTTGLDSREITASLKGIYDNLNKDSVEFISIYIDSALYPDQSINNDSISWRVIPDKKCWASDVVDAYNIEYIPNSILISPQGIISGRDLPLMTIESKLKTLKKNNQ